jgi:hypothetical protein
MIIGTVATDSQRTVSAWLSAMPRASLATLLALRIPKIDLVRGQQLVQCIGGAPVAGVGFPPEVLQLT